MCLTVASHPVVSAYFRNHFSRNFNLKEALLFIEQAVRGSTFLVILEGP